MIKVYCFEVQITLETQLKNWFAKIPLRLKDLLNINN